MKMSLPILTVDGVKAWLKENLLLFLTFTGVLSCFIFGIFLRKMELSPETILLIAYPGELFMRLLKFKVIVGFVIAWNNKNYHISNIFLIFERKIQSADF